MPMNTSQNKIEVTGRNVSEAREAAAQQLGVDEDKVQIEILENATSGFFGIAAKPCKIAAWVETESEADLMESVGGSGSRVQRTETFLTKIIPMIGGMEAHLDIQETEDQAMLVDISGDNMGIIIGRRGETLDALQYLTSIVVNKGEDDYTRVTLDTENYRQKRTEALEKLAHKIAAKVVRNGRSMTLEPMNPFERRIIHAALQNDEAVYTASVGEEPERRVVINLAKKDRPKYRS